MLYCEGRPYQNSNDSSVHLVFRGRQHIHLFADTAQELIDYACNILGMKASWIQRDNNFIHFDVTGFRMNRVLVDDRVVKLSRQDFVDKIRSLRKIK